ncbi:MAG: hypothetical protein ASARMPREDX12_005058 [Alectoria sarmentosa]|nr:MAG: hypothetical protein ASARMPREDX12_005058 [Alectoria sarmentosa]
MPELSDFQVGQTVELSNGVKATVQFVGNTHFAPGDWIGIELEDALGKNDGAVQGQRYFDCPLGHGMFIRPSVPKIVDESTPKPTARPNGKADGTATRERPPTMAVGGARRQSSPNKSPTKQIGSSISGKSTAGTTTAPTAARKSMLPPTKRTSMGPPTRAPRPSIVSTMNGSERPSSQTSSSVSRGPSDRPSMRPAARDKLGSVSGESQHSADSIHESPAESSEPEAFSPPPVSESQDDRSKGAVISPLSQASGISLPASSRGKSSPSTSKRPSTAGTVSQREVEDLKTKLRLMEKKRMEDREKLKTLDKVQADRDRFEGIIQKMQSKYQPQQQEIAELKKRLKEEEAKYQALESQQAENDTMYEMTTLDREMAEEIAESLKIELDSLQQKHEELELEVEVLREENQELGKEISPEEKTSQGWLQMERSNERYREALVLLRDAKQQQEAAFKGQVADLEEDVEALNKIKDEHTHTKEKLSQSESTLVELREQLDNALGAEEMIEELTEKNMTLIEQMDELRQTIEDLESLKELNDELEVNHTETEKQLQYEIDYSEALLAEEARKSAVQDGTIQDLEYTVTRFRDLVTSMQSDLEDMRASQQISETEANELNSRSRAMMDLNMRLHVSASKAQVKAIDLELGKIEAHESSEHLAIVQLFLPDSFNSERDSVQALLRFRRIGFKANMMHHFVKERMHGQATPSQDDDIFPCCDVLDKLTWVSSTCNRFINHIETCDLEAFRRLGGASYELEPVERAVNVWVDGLKRDELKSEKCAMELQRSIALMSHLAEVHIGEDLVHYADEVNVRATMIQSYLENSATALSHIKSMSEAKASTTSIESDEKDADCEEFLQKMDALISQTRSAKVISSKATRQLQDLKSRSLTLEPSTLNTVETAQNAASEFASFTRTAGVSVLQVLTEEARNIPVSYEVLLDQMPFSSLATKLNSVTGQLQTFYNLSNSLAQTAEFPSPPPPPPWKLLAQNMRAATADMAAQETEFARLKDEVAEKNTTLAMKDKTVEEMGVKVEILEKRVGESGGRREKVRELEATVEAARSHEKDLIGKLTHLQNELRTLEAERDNWKESPQIAEPTLQSGQMATAPTSHASLRQIETLKSEIRALQSSVRYLRSASSSHTLSFSYGFLSAPITTPEPVPPLVQAEAKDVLKEMLNLVSQPDNQIVRLQSKNKADRLRWRPARETSDWKVQKQKEEWAEWREWRDCIARKSAMSKKEEERRREARRKHTAREREPLARLQVQLPGKMESGHEVKIVRPGEWERLEEALGLNVG